MASPLKSSKTSQGAFINQDKVTNKI